MWAPATRVLPGVCSKAACSFWVLSHCRGEGVAGLWGRAWVEALDQDSATAWSHVPVDSLSGQG